MFILTVLESKVPLFFLIVWCQGGLLEALVLPLPSVAKLEPIEGGLRHARAQNTWPMDISSFVSAPPLLGRALI
jgi:hypothetical protein